MNDKIKNITEKLKIALFVGAMAVFFIIGLLFFLRPKTSEAEKRELTKFPKFSVSSFLSGEWTSNVSLWYADTYPMREGMIGMNKKLESLYGIRGEQVFGSGNADVIPESGGDLILNLKDDGKGTAIDGLYVNKDTAYELYYFSKQGSDNYVYLVNQFAKQVKGKTNVYNMLVPKHYQIALSEETVKKAGASDCNDAIEYMYGNLADNVTPIRILPKLLEHSSEYLYFRTDHHWTARGAYYAYVAFCNQKGISPSPLSSYQSLKFNGFLGSLYRSPLNKNQDAMEKNPDYVEAFVPNGTNKITVTDIKGNINEHSIVNKQTDAWYPASGSKYNCFIAGDNPISEIHNSKINDGSSIVVIKESFGNAFVPFLVDSYQHIYVIDYRHWNGNLADFVVSKGIDDVLFLNVLGNSSSYDNLTALKEIIE